MRDFFHWESTLPEWRDRFNRAVTEGAMVLAVSCVACELIYHLDQLPC